MKARGAGMGLGSPLEALQASRVQAVGTRPARIGAENPVGEGFEALLLSQLFQTMQKTVSKSGLFGDQAGGDMYGHMVEVAMGEHLAASGGIGLAELFEGGGAPGLRVHEATRRPAEPRPAGVESARMPASEGERPLAEILPPQEDRWLDGPEAALKLRQLLAGDGR